MLFALVPTVYAAENTLLYIPNEVFAASFDGVPTLISPLVGLTVFVVVAVATNGSLAPSPAPSAPTDRDGSLVPGPAVRFRTEANRGVLSRMDVR